jgi:FtsP/CotA-like multicopper oxidase with cupredoxin domain
MINRRQFIHSAGATAASVSLANLPGLALAKTDTGQLELRAKITEYPLPGEPYAASKLWLYDGSLPGPEIRVRKGDLVRIRFINELDEPTSIHWHGIRIKNAMDGVSGLTQDPVEPGQSFDYEFEVPDSGTFWYHAHNKSWQQVARGLYGPLIVEDEVPAFDRNHDITLMMDDWRLDQNGQLHLASLGDVGDWSHAGRLGNFITVNGQLEPSFKLNRGEDYRLRLINACNARVLIISPAALGAKILGFDGFDLTEPLEPQFDTLPIAPAQRVDLLVRGETLDPARLNDVGDFALQELTQTTAYSMAKFEFLEPTNGVQKATSISLSPNAIPVPDLDNAVDVTLDMTGGAMGRTEGLTYQGRQLNINEMFDTGQVWAFNGVANLADQPLFRVERGQTIRLKTLNRTGWIHGMHVHGHHFRILSRQREELVKDAWRDTFLIDGDETVEIAFVADNPGKWLLHCHMLEHAAGGMNTWFEVV